MFNLGKLVVAGAMFTLGSVSHKEEHFLKEDEKKDTTVVQHIGSRAHYLVHIFLGFAIAVGWLLGVDAFSGPWTADETASALLAFAALALRRWAVITLQHYFTYTVGLRKDHKLIRSGPYTLLRHPSYTGTVLFVFGAFYFLGYRNSLLWPPIVVPVLYLTGVRIANEEQVLLEAFGTECEEHFKSTWRLIPFVY